MISLYCSEKIDGLTSAAIIMRHAQLCKLPAHFAGFLHPENIFTELQEIATEEHKLIFILDIPLQPEHLFLIDAIQKNNKLVYWNTHDLSSAAIPAPIFESAPARTTCATLTRARFLPHDPIAKQLATISHNITFFQNDDIGYKLADLIALRYNPLELLESLSRGVFWNQKFEHAYIEHQKKKLVALEELLHTLTIKNYLSYRFGFALAHNFITSAEAGEKILSGHAGVDVACVLFRDGRITFRTRENISLDLKPIAELFRGGGHSFAAGSKLSHTISKETFQDTLFAIDQTLKNHFLRNN